MLRLGVLAILLTTVFACNSPANEVSVTEEKPLETKEEIKAAIQEIDDSLMVLFSKAMETDEFQIDSKIYFETIRRNQLLLVKYPNDEGVEKALERIAAIYLQLNLEDEAVKWRDTLLTRFPDTQHKEGLLELQMNYYDLNVHNPEKVEFYLNKLLEIENLSPEKREQYEFRLENIDKTLEELIIMQMND